METAPFKGNSCIAVRIKLSMTFIIAVKSDEEGYFLINEANYFLIITFLTLQQIYSPFE
jgi:hypothetical protein